MPPFVLKPEEIGENIPKILGLGTAYFAGQCLNTVIKMGVPDALGDEKLTVASLAAKLEGQPNEEVLFRCMRLLAVQGIFDETAGPDGEFVFGLTPMGALLQTAAPQPSMACGMYHWNEKALWDAWCTLPDLAAGKTDATTTPFAAANGGDEIFQYYKKHPESGAQFNQFMTFFSTGELDVLLNIFPWASLEGKKVVDVGGNHGTVMGAVKAKFPQVETVSFDLPEVIADAKSPPPGVELVSGDMFDAETIPQCDAVFMKHILHDWSDENSVKILRSCSSVLNEGGCIYNVECVLPNAGETTDHKAQQVHLDALMMTIGGKERTVKQWHDLAAAAGLRVTEVIPTPIPSAHIVVMKKA